MKQSKFFIAAIILVMLATIVVGCDSTPSDVTPPIISEVATSDITSDTTTITWTTDEPATSQVEYGKTDQYGESTTLDVTLTTTHKVTLTGLDWETTYYFRAKSKDDSGNQAISSNFTFTTTKKVWTDGRLGLILDRVERTDTWPSDIEYYPSWSTPTPKEGCDFFCIRLTIAYIGDIFFKVESGRPWISFTLLDTEGNEESCQSIIFGIVFGIGTGKITEGSEMYWVSELPKLKKPASLKFVYRYRNIGEDDYQEGQIDIILP